MSLDDSLLACPDCRAVGFVPEYRVWRGIAYLFIGLIVLLAFGIQAMRASAGIGNFNMGLLDFVIIGTATLMITRGYVMFTKPVKKCPMCGHDNCIPLDSERGREIRQLAQKHRAVREVPNEPKKVASGL